VRVRRFRNRRGKLSNNCSRADRTIPLWAGDADGQTRSNRTGLAPGQSKLSGDCGSLLKVFDVLGRHHIAADTPVTAFDFVDRDPRDTTQRLSLDVHHCLGELGDHLFLLAAIEHSLDDFDLYEWHDASFIEPGLGVEIKYLGGGCASHARFLPSGSRGCKRSASSLAIMTLMASDLEFRVLGAIELERRGQAVPIGGPKPRLALALLATRRGSVVSTDRLCEELWGSNAPADPLGVLQSYLSRLRRALRPEAEIVARPPGYVLQVPDEMIDAGRFEQLFRQASSSSNPKVTVELLEGALACWRGAAFAEFAEHDWARLEAMRLDELHVLAQEELFEARLALGGHAALVGDLEALVALHPLRERFWQQLIVALYRSGRSAEALRRAEVLRVVLREELGLDPSPALRELEARVLNDDPTLLQPAVTSRRSVTRQLPTEPTRLVGRAEELLLLASRLRLDRLVTLTGPGGVGKTRLAMRLAGELWDEFDGEVYVTELAPVRDATSTVAAIATALDVQQRQHLSIEETLVEYLRARRALLVLDNCEHLRGTIASFSERLLRWCPGVTILATSREVLGLPGEHVWRVQPLAIPDEGAGPAAASEAPATRLFVECAIAARPGFALGPDNVKDVIEIVGHLDGLPLAIELAAARIRAMGPAALAERLRQGLDLLAGAQTSIIPRHRTVQDLVAWSYDLLDADEQLLFARLCVFAGSFGLDAVEQVCAARDVGKSAASLLLANLVDKSMVQLVDEDLPRYRLLETLREYGRDRLSEAERKRARARHAAWYLEVAERCARSLAGPDEATAIQMLDRDFDNLRAAHRWSMERPDVDTALRLVAALREYSFRCMHAEIASWADAAIALPDACAHERYPVTVGVAAYGRFVRGDLEGAIELGEQAVTSAHQLGVDGSGLAERALGNAWFYRGDYERGSQWTDRMIASAQRGSPARLAHALYMRSVAFVTVADNVEGARFAADSGVAAANSGSPTALAQALYAQGLTLKSTSPLEATVELQRAADIARDVGNRWIQAFALTEVLWLEARQGRPRQALARYIDVIDLWYRGGDWANQWLSLRHVFGILVQLRADLAAATLHGALAAAGSAYALPFEAVEAQRINVLADDLRERLGAAAFASAVRRGSSLSDGEIIEFVRAQIRALAPPTTHGS
jgi:predicted ATPase/DNA-binding SARP family transcriptional activator